MRILLSEGSGLTSRQVAVQLAARGHTVGVLSSDPVGLTRWTRAVRRWHPVPRFGAAPLSWLDSAAGIATEHGYEMLLPTQEQAAVVSWACSRGTWPATVPTSVPRFSSLARVQDKISSARTLDRIGLPRPRWQALTQGSAPGTGLFPAWVKLPVATASTGVHRVRDEAELAAVLALEPFATAVGSSGVLLEEEIDGELLMVQSIFDEGRLVAFHATRRLVEGVGGGACHKESLRHDAVRSDTARLGRVLSWHGALSADVILAPDGGHWFIDINPRLVEPGNALRSGVDLVGALVETALGHGPDELAAGREGVRTHQLLLALLGAARGSGRRRTVWRELARAARGTGEYEGSAEELTPLRGDPLAAVPLLAALALTTVRPSLWRVLASTSTGSYAMTPGGWDALLST